MALHTTLPIYKVAYDLLGVATDGVLHMPRSVKQSIGNRLSELCTEVVLLIFKANCAKDKTPHLDVIMERLEELQLLFRLCRDKRFVSTSIYARAVELANSAGAQANGWRKSIHASPVI